MTLIPILDVTPEDIRAEITVAERHPEITEAVGEWLACIDWSGSDLGPYAEVIGTFSGLHTDFCERLIGRDDYLARLAELRADLAAAEVERVCEYCVSDYDDADHWTWVGTHYHMRDGSVRSTA